MSRMIDDEEELKDYGLIEKCSNLVADENRCLDTWDDENADYKECKRINCYKKQLKRLEAENEKLKLMTGIYSVRLMEKYKQALDEVEKYCNECNLKADFTACEILRIISEVLNDKF